MYVLCQGYLFRKKFPGDEERRGEDDKQHPAPVRVYRLSARIVLEFQSREEATAFRVSSHRKGSNKWSSLSSSD